MNSLQTTHNDEFNEAPMMNSCQTMHNDELIKDEAQ
jgi:hypothetical protein